MHRKLPEECGRAVLAIFRFNLVDAGAGLAFGLVRSAFLEKDRQISELSDGITFLIHHGCLRRGSPDDDVYYLTELGAALIVPHWDVGDHQNQKQSVETSAHDF